MATVLGTFPKSLRDAPTIETANMLAYVDEEEMLRVIGRISGTTRSVGKQVHEIALLATGFHLRDVREIRVGKIATMLDIDRVTLGHHGLLAETALGEITNRFSDDFSIDTIDAIDIVQPELIAQEGPIRIGLSRETKSSKRLIAVHIQIRAMLDRILHVAPLVMKRLAIEVAMDAIVSKDSSFYPKKKPEPSALELSEVLLGSHKKPASRSSIHTIRTAAASLGREFALDGLEKDFGSARKFFGPVATHTATTLVKSDLDALIKADTMPIGIAPQIVPINSHVRRTAVKLADYPGFSEVSLESILVSLRTGTMPVAGIQPEHIIWNPTEPIRLSTKQVENPDAYASVSYAGPQPSSITRVEQPNAISGKSESFYELLLPDDGILIRRSVVDDDRDGPAKSGVFVGKKFSKAD